MLGKDKVLETSEGYNGIAERYFAEWHKYSPEEVEYLERFAQMVGEGADYLDAGCGTGKDLFYLTQNHGLNGYGIDLSDGMLAQALKVNRKDDLNVPLLKGDIRALPFSDEFFDAVWTNSVLVHLPNRDSVFEEWYRVTRPDGIIHVCVQNRQHPYYVEKQRETMEREGTELGYAHYDGRHWFYPIQGELVKRLEVTGFSIIETGSPEQRWLRIYARK